MGVSSLPLPALGHEKSRQEQYKSRCGTRYRHFAISNIATLILMIQRRERQGRGDSESKF